MYRSKWHSVLWQNHYTIHIIGTKNRLNFQILKLAFRFPHPVLHIQYIEVMHRVLHI